MGAAFFLFCVIWTSFAEPASNINCNKIAKCISCIKPDNEVLCTECGNGFFINNNGTCSECQGPCLSCASWNNCSDCKEGHYGTWCSLDCDNNCIQTECYQYNGTCVHGCNSGYYQANSKCLRCSIQNCEECSDHHHCTKCSNGYSLNPTISDTLCESGCPFGTWGEICHYNCSSSCDTGCNRTNGHCYRCKKYTYGDDCQFLCNEGCEDSFRFEVCDKQTGRCIYGCKPGYSGVLCENPPTFDGQWGQWSESGTCSVTCGEGSRLRTRSCNSLSTWTGGQHCDGNNVETIGCNLTSCPVDGHWGQWSEFGPCSVTCGSGTKSRNRSCDNPARRNGGQNCIGNNIEETYCNVSSCPVDGQWGQWSDFGNCSVMCGPGLRSRARSCDQPEPKHGGGPCTGNDTETESCNVTSCYFIVEDELGGQDDESPENNGNIGASSGNESDGVMVGGTAGGAVMFVVLCVVLAAVCLFRRRQPRKDGEEVFYENETPADAVESNNYNTIPSQENSVQTNDHQTEDTVYAQPDKPKKTKMNDSVENQNEEYFYSIPNKDKAKGSDKKKKGKDKGKRPGEATQAPPLPSKLPHYMEDDDLEEINESNVAEMDKTSGKISDESGAYYNTTGLIRRKIPLKKLAKTVAEKPEKEIIKEYQRLSDGLLRDYTAAVKSENKYRNRYKKILPYDATRVKLTGGSSDYINASFIDGYKEPKAYIACLGPTVSTMDNFALFWTMVWQQMVDKIVMLTKLMEGEKMKCEQYWPETAHESYGDITVHRISEIKYAEFTIRNFEVDKGSERRRVCQIHYIAWPDRGVPDDVTSLLEFRHKVVAIPTTLNGPTVVHCSAGIGRTGTYIALDMLIKEGLAEKSVDVFGCVNGIRGQRVNMVQNVTQYTFLHHALVHELTLPSQLLSSEQLAWYVSTEGRTDLQKQFEQLKTVIERTPDSESESITRNRVDFKSKNRKGADIPDDRHRVQLSSTKHRINDYINAVFVDGYMKMNQFIVAQTPLGETVVDFIGLVMQENVSCIVSMDPDTQDKTAGKYLPLENQTLKIGKYTASCTKSETFSSYVMRTLEVSKRQGRGEEKRTVYHFQQTIWQSHEPVPSDAVNFVRMVSEVEQTATKSGGNGETLIHCFNAAERSGLFCIVAILVQKLRYEQKISVLNTVRLFKTRRRMAISTTEQYIFCHECVVANQMSVSNTYTNVDWQS